MYLNMAVVCLTASDGAGEFCQDLEVKGPKPTVSLGKSLSCLRYEIYSEISILKESVQASGDKQVCG